MSIYWSALLLAVCANISANVALKLAVLGFSGPLDIRATLTAPWAWVGVISCILLLGGYLIAIRGVELSIAYPIVTGLAMVGIAIMGHVLFAEALNLQKLVGIGFIIAGVVVLSQVKPA